MDGRAARTTTDETPPAPQRARPKNVLNQSARQDELTRVVSQRGFTHIDEISAMFGISSATARTDLRALAARGVLQRVRGGAVPVVRQTRQERSAPPAAEWERPQAHHLVPGRGAGVPDDEELGAVAVTASALLRSGDTVAIDAGATGRRVAEALVRRTELTDIVAVTADLQVALALAEAHERVRVVVTGGALRPGTAVLEGEPVRATLADLRVDVALLGCDGITYDAVTTTEEADAGLWQLLFHASRRRVVLAHGAAIGRRDGLVLCVPEVLDACVVGASADPDELDLLQDTGLAVVTTAA